MSSNPGEGQRARLGGNSRALHKLPPVQRARVEDRTIVARADSAEDRAGFLERRAPVALAAEVEKRCSQAFRAGLIDPEPGPKARAGEADEAVEGQPGAVLDNGSATHGGANQEDAFRAVCLRPRDCRRQVAPERERASRLELGVAVAAKVEGEYAKTVGEERLRVGKLLAEIAAPLVGEDDRGRTLSRLDRIEANTVRRSQPDRLRLDSGGGATGVSQRRGCRSGRRSQHRRGEEGECSCRSTHVSFATLFS